MNTVAANQAQVKDLRPERTINDVISWVETQTKKGDLAESSGRLAATGLRALAQQVAEGEPNTAQWVHDNMDLLLQRWVRRNPEMKTDTARTYGSRARTVIKEFQRWDAEPAAYRPKAARSSSRAEKKPEESAKKRPMPLVTRTTPTVVQQPVAPPPQPQPAPPPPPVAEHVRKVQPGDLRECPLGSDRTFQYLPPTGGMKLKEALRVAFHLFTICDDYDPMVSPSQVFTSMQRSEQQ